MRILVTGAGGPAGRSLLDQLHAAGVACLGVDMAPPRREDGVEVLRCLPVSDPDHVEELRDLVVRRDVDLVVPTVQEELPVLAAANLPQVLVSPLAAVEIAADKWLTTLALAQAGLGVPRTALAEQLDAEQVAWLGTPCLSKPRVARGGRGITVHPEAIRLPRDPGLVVCEFVPGQEYCPNVWLDAAGSEVVVLRKTGLKQGLHGNATGVVVVDEPDVAELALDACRVLGVRGPADVDIRRRADGLPVVLEVNARFGANSAAAPVLLERLLDHVHLRSCGRRPDLVGAA